MVTYVKNAALFESDVEKVIRPNAALRPPPNKSVNKNHPSSDLLSKKKEFHGKVQFCTSRTFLTNFEGSYVTLQIETVPKI